MAPAAGAVRSARAARRASHLSQAGAEVAGEAVVGRLAEGQEKAGRLSAARWLRGQRRGGTGLGKPPSAGPGPASPTQRPGNLGTFHCLRSFTKQIVPITMGLRRRAAHWGVKETSGLRRSPVPGACLLGSRTGSPAPLGAQSAAPRCFPVLQSES